MGKAQRAHVAATNVGTLRLAHSTQSNAPMTLPEKLLAGHHAPLGSHVRNGGINFAVFSQHAEQIELCIFDASGAKELKRYVLHGPCDGVFQGFLPGLSAGLVYGLRAHGAYAPEHGHRFNAHKLLLDPYAREIVGHFAWRSEHHGYEIGHPQGARSFDTHDNATTALKARVAAPRAAANTAVRSRAPRIASGDVVLYEVHVKGFSKLHPEVARDLRGTYAGLAHAAAIAHFKSLGVTTLSLLPVQYCIDEPALAEKGLKNYWGYNTLGFFCPDPRLAAAKNDPTAVVEEFRTMVDTLHANGLEVVLDVVYNHTPEGNEFGPTLSFRGLDNASWYRLVRDDKSRAENLTGCGNTLNVEHPRVTQFVLDSLRYWVTEMGVDGFRFDLAPVLGRNNRGFDPGAGFFTALRQDPVLADVHLIAEPWDAGFDGYQLGRFPGRFLEWNDKFRDAVRGYWLRKAAGGTGRGEFARRFNASNDVFQTASRQPSASINFVSVHDGYSLHDFTAYQRKHNEANGENNRDGRDGEACDNSGIEGETDDATINATRDRVRRAILATVILAQGTPMLCAGDEIGNSQSGNNNAYCQDNETGWLNWNTADHALQQYVSELLALRKSTPALRLDRWFSAHPASARERSVVWINTRGNEMTQADWHDGGQSALAGVIYSESGAILIVFNPEESATSFALPQGRWVVALDSSGEFRQGAIFESGATLSAAARSVVVLACR